MKEYAVYKGDELLVLGTIEECARSLAVNKETIRFYSTPSYKKRIEHKDYQTRIVAEIVEYDEALDA